MRLPFTTRPPARLARLTSPTSLAVGAGVVAAAAGALWRIFQGNGSEHTPEQIASITAQAVAEAARESVLEATEEAQEPLEIAVAAAAAEAVREAALAGADVIAAALGALDGAQYAARTLGRGREEALDAARLGILSAARDIGQPAVDRVERVLDRRAR